jgi:hypothetical protein
LAIVGAVQWVVSPGGSLQGPGDDARHDLGAQRRKARGTDLVAQETVHAFIHEPLLPTPNAGLANTCLAPDLVRPNAVRRKKHDASPPKMLLRTISDRRDRLKASTIRRVQINNDPCAHFPDSHIRKSWGIHKRTLPSDFIH